MCLFISVNIHISFKTPTPYRLANLAVRPFFTGVIKERENTVTKKEGEGEPSGVNSNLQIEESSRQQDRDHKCIHDNPGIEPAATSVGLLAKRRRNLFARGSASIPQQHSPGHKRALSQADERFPFDFCLFICLFDLGFY